MPQCSSTLKRIWKDSIGVFAEAGLRWPHKSDTSTFHSIKKTTMSIKGHYKSNRKTINKRTSKSSEAIARFPSVKTSSAFVYDKNCKKYKILVLFQGSV